MAWYCKPHDLVTFDRIIPPTGIGWLDAAIARFVQGGTKDQWQLILNFHPAFDEFDKQHLKNKMDCEYLDWYFFAGGKEMIQTRQQEHDESGRQFQESRTELVGYHTDQLFDIDVGGPGLLGPKGQKLTAKNKNQQPTTTETKKKELDVLAFVGVVVGIIGIAIAIRR